MSILILGAAGNLGGQLKKIFADREITTWDRTDFDFLDFEELKSRLERLKPSLVINAAAYNAVDKCESDEVEAALAWKLNRDLPAVLADYCLSSGVFLIHYSTDYVFGGDNRLAGAYNELSCPEPVNVYGQTKLGGEQEIARRALPGLKYYLIRTSKLFGPSGDNPLAKPSFFDMMLALAEKNSEVKAVDGEMSCFTYTPDLAAATKSLIDDQAPRGIYHIINSEPATWYEGAKELFAIRQIDKKLLPVSPDEWQRPAKRPVYSVLENTRRPLLRSWRAALREYLNL